MTTLDLYVGRRLRRLRMQKGLSQAELGLRLAVSPLVVDQMERGRLRASPGELARASAALDVSVVYFFEDISLALEALEPAEPTTKPLMH